MSMRHSYLRHAPTRPTAFHRVGEPTHHQQTLDNIVQDIFVENAEPFEPNINNDSNPCEVLFKLRTLARLIGRAGSSKGNGWENEEAKRGFLVRDDDLDIQLHSSGMDGLLSKLANETLERASTTSPTSSNNCYESTIARYKSWCDKRHIPPFPIIVPKTSLFLHFFAMEPITTKGRIMPSHHHHHHPSSSNSPPLSSSSWQNNRKGRRSPTTIRNAASYLEWARKRTMVVFANVLDERLLQQSITEHAITHTIADVAKTYLNNLPLISTTSNHSSLHQPSNPLFTYEPLHPIVPFDNTSPEQQPQLFSPSTYHHHQQQPHYSLSHESFMIPYNNGTPSTPSHTTLNQATSASSSFQFHHPPNEQPFSFPAFSPKDHHYHHFPISPVNAIEKRSLSISSPSDFPNEERRRGIITLGPGSSTTGGRTRTRPRSSSSRMAIENLLN